MGERPVYRTLVFDSSRWEGFAFRDGDIVISTPPKSGTTWTQTLCAYLLFATTELPAPLAELSPWLDMLTSSRDDVVALLDAQHEHEAVEDAARVGGQQLLQRTTAGSSRRTPRSTVSRSTTG